MFYNFIVLSLHHNQTNKTDMKHNKPQFKTSKKHPLGVNNTVQIGHNRLRLTESKSLDEIQLMDGFKVELISKTATWSRQGASGCWFSLSNKELFKILKENI